jgi:hypothetical protein
MYFLVNLDKKEALLIKERYRVVLVNPPIGKRELLVYPGDDLNGVPVRYEEEGGK